jgi:hypothetical protein
MTSTLPPSADSQNSFEDLSGVDSAAFANPYDALIEACHDDPVNLYLPLWTETSVLGSFTSIQILLSSI